MRLRAPTSKTKFRAKLAPFDALWAIATPFLALALRDPSVLEQSDAFGDFGPAYQYAFTTVFFAFVSFLVFRISDGMSHLFSVHDVLAICGAVATTVASSSLTLFVLTRMDGVPRSTPLIYALLLGAGLIVARTMARVSHVEASVKEEPEETPSLMPQHVRRVMVIGADRFAAATIKLVDCQRPRTTQIVAALDPRMHFHGRTINGVKIVGRVEELEEVVAEYQVHGVEIDEVWLSDDAAALPAEALERLSEQCENRGLKLKRIAAAFNLEPRVQEEAHPVVSQPTAEIELTEYFELKRILDIIASAGLLIALAPLAAIAACLVLYDVGAPILFWQQRIGRNGRKFLLYKFRTYHAPFDRRGNKIAQEDRLSRLGRASPRRAAGRNSAVAERPRRRHVAHRAATLAADRSAFRSAPAPFRAAGDHGLGAAQRRHLRHAGGKGRARRLVHQARLAGARSEDRHQDAALFRHRRREDESRGGGGSGSLAGGA